MEDVSVILPGLWLGSYHSVKHYRVLADSVITNVLSIMTYDEIVDRNIEIPESIDWGVIPVEDNGKDSMIFYLKSALKTIDDAIGAGGRILVHCMGGISRSPTVVVAYVMWKLGLRLTAAMEYVRGRRACIDPNWVFYGDLVKFEEGLFRQMEMGDVPNKTR
jgi:serine/threonine/tyrosine-interacting protein